MSINRYRKRSGFTLIEVLVSLVIFLVTSMGLLPLLVTNLQVNHGNSMHARARRVTSEVMTELQISDYAALSLVPAAPLLVADIEVYRQVEENVPQADQSQLTVTSRWQQQGHLCSYQLQTIRSAP